MFSIFSCLNLCNSLSSFWVCLNIIRIIMYCLFSFRSYRTIETHNVFNNVQTPKHNRALILDIYIILMQRIIVCLKNVGGHVNTSKHIVVVTEISNLLNKGFEFN